MLALAGELDTLRKTLDPASSHGIVTTAGAAGPRQRGSVRVAENCAHVALTSAYLDLESHHP